MWGDEARSHLDRGDAAHRERAHLERLQAQQRLRTPPRRAGRPPRAARAAARAAAAEAAAQARPQPAAGRAARLVLLDAEADLLGALVLQRREERAPLRVGRRLRKEGRGW